MKSLLGLLCAALLSSGVCACGDSSSTTTTTTTTSDTSTSPVANASDETATDYSKADADKDNDIGASHDDTSNNRVLDFGKAADADDRRAITATLKRYYATALAGDGTRACSMIYSPLAEAAAEDYGQPGGPPYLLGAKTCQAVTSGVFKHFHALLAIEVPKLAVVQVRRKERQAMALLSFGGLPEREISLTHEGRVWKLAALLDSELP